MAINWALMGPPPDVGGHFAQGVKLGQGIVARKRAESALATLGRNPDDPAALNALWQSDPVLASSFETSSMKRREYAREQETRSALADLVLTGRGPTTPALGGQSGAASLSSPAVERAVRADPEAYLKFQGKRLDVTKQQLEGARDLNAAAMQLLGGVNDQATYDRAKQQALKLYSNFGQDASEFINGLPAEFSPELVDSLRLQGMDTSKQFAAIARENKLAWDIQDDLDDNERADRNTDSLIGYRQERLEDFDAAEAGRDRRHRTPRPSTARGPANKGPSPTSVIGRIMDKQARGEALTPGEQKTYDEYRYGKGRGGRGSTSPGASRAAVIVNPKTGQRMKLEGGKWVPIK